jgi:gamma-glutamyltranspeptidase/glutathione hydrolase
MTTTVESLFGSQRMAAGFFLNNQLTDFSFLPRGANGLPIANAPAAGKKPRSSMSPTIVFRDGQFELAVGSPGGNGIIGYVSKSLVGMLDWNLTPQQAIDLPNIVARGPVLAEGRLDPALREGLVSLGHRFGQGRGAEGSGLHAVRVLPDGRLSDNSAGLNPSSRMCRGQPLYAGDLGFIARAVLARRFRFTEVPDDVRIPCPPP